MKCARTICLLFFTGGLFMSCLKEELIAATPVTEMQKLMAEKAFKMPGEKAAGSFPVHQRSRGFSGSNYGRLPAPTRHSHAGMALGNDAKRTATPSAQKFQIANFENRSSHRRSFWSASRLLYHRFNLQIK